MKLKMQVTKRFWKVEWPKNLNKTALAKLLGVTPQAVQQWVAAETIPDRFVEVVAKIPAKDVLHKEAPANEAV